jgi:hypothetical protein
MNGYPAKCASNDEKRLIFAPNAVARLLRPRFILLDGVVIEKYM